MSGTTVDWGGKLERFTTAEDAQPLLEALGANPEAETIVLSGNTFGVEAAQAVADALKSNTALKKAIMSDMFTTRLYSEVPPAIESIAKVFSTKPTLEEIDLSDNALGKYGAAAFIGLCTVIPTLKHVHANNGGLGIRGGRVIARELLTAQGLDPSVIEVDEDDDETAVSCLGERPEGTTTQLETFTAGRNRLENPGAIALSKAFASLMSLKRLELPQNGIKPEGIQALSTALANIADLEVLNLNDNTIKEEGAGYIGAALPSLRKLKVLNLGDCMLGEGVADIIKGLAGTTSLEVLDLSYNDIEDDTAIELAAVVARQTNLKSLNLNGNCLKAAGKAAIASALQAIDADDALGSMSDNEDSDEEDSDEEEENDDADQLTDKMAELSV